MKIPRFLHSSLSILLAVGLTLPATLAETSIVFIAGARSHKSGDHEFNAGCLLLANALNSQQDLDIKAEVLNQGWSADEANKSKLTSADAVIVYADATKGLDGQFEFFDELAKKGKGLMFMHYAVHPSVEDGERYFRPWIGGAFETGKSVNPFWLADLKVLQGHEVSQGVPEVVETIDEWYYNIQFPTDDRLQKVRRLGQATPTAERFTRINNLWNEEGYGLIGKPQTLLWGYERDGGGRGAGFTGGHHHANWALDGLRTLVLNTIVWTAGLEVPEGGVKSPQITEDMLNENLDDYGSPNPRIAIPNLEEMRSRPSDPNLTVEAWKEARAKNRKPKKK